MTKATKEKLFNKKNIRILLIASVCVLALCVTILPMVAFGYTKNKLGITPPESEQTMDPTNTTPQTPETPAIAWVTPNVEVFNYQAVEGSSDLYISGVKEGNDFESEYIILPHEIIGGSKIVGVADNAFAGNSQIKGLVIPNVYNFIGENSFKGCTKLETIILGNTIKETEESLAGRELMTVLNGAFDECVALKSLSIGVSVGNIGESFAGCNLLSEILIYSKEIYEGLFTKTTLGGALETCQKVFVYSDVYSGKNPYLSKYYTMGQTVIEGKSYNEYSLIKVLYEIKLHTNGGSILSETVKYEPNSSKALPEPELQHYDFCGWYLTNAFLEEEKVESIAEDMKGCFDLYAKWELKQYQIHYILSTDATNVENPTTFDVTSDDIVFKEPQRAGYLFDGWYYY